jgi:hypothetical protein
MVQGNKLGEPAGYFQTDAPRMALEQEDTKVFLQRFTRAPTLDRLTLNALTAWRKPRYSVTVSVWTIDARGKRDPSEVGTPH